DRSLHALGSFGRRLSKSRFGSLQHAAWHWPWPPSRQGISDRPSWGFQRPHAGGHLERCRDGARSGGCTASERRRGCGVGLLSYDGQGTRDGKLKTILFLRRGSRFGHVIARAGSGLKPLIGDVDTDSSEGPIHLCVAWTVADLILRPQLIMDVEKTTGKILKLEGE